MDRIAAHYSKKNESQRLLSGRGELEFVRTKQIIEQYLPNESGLSIADVGGGSGPYAFWLARKGHRVSLFDLVPEHIEEAVSINETVRDPLTRVEVADVRSLDLEPQRYDVVLLLGPMYHLISARERRQILRKAADWLSPDGVGFVAYISRSASMLDGFTQRLYEDPEFLDIVRQDLETGVHRPNMDNTRYFTDAYFHHPDEIVQEAEEAHLQVVDLIAVEGIAWMWQNFDEMWADPRERAILLEMVDRTDRDRSLMGVSSHVLLVFKKRAACTHQ
ncbi:MAG: class I SAM-dependent methyltransferase [Gemmatimonadetes bacterium]|nr:class I SAM-dependent methyltransferase [Gemmatimonadota bacterium]